MTRAQYFVHFAGDVAVPEEVNDKRISITVLLITLRKNVVNINVVCDKKNFNRYTYHA